MGCQWRRKELFQLPSSRRKEFSETWSKRQLCFQSKLQAKDVVASKKKMHECSKQLDVNTMLVWQGYNLNKVPVNLVIEDSQRWRNPEPFFLDLLWKKENREMILVLFLVQMIIKMWKYLISWPTLELMYFFEFWSLLLFTLSVVIILQNLNNELFNPF